MIRPVLLLTAAAAALAAGTTSANVEEAQFRAALDAFVAEMAADHDFDPAELEALLGSAERQQPILDAISRPAERVLAWHEYRDIFLTEKRIAGGAEFWAEHREALERISAEYGVAPEYLVAIIGVETLYGRITGRWRVLDALSTLAFAYPPRARFFRSELEHFLLLAREEGLEPDEVRGSYAGAMGPPQFIPSSYRAYAADGNDDGIRNLLGDWEDVLASVANYFAEHGWRPGAEVAVRLAARDGVAASPDGNGLELDRTVAALAEAGFELPPADALPGDTPAMLVALEGEDGPEYWAGLHNFRVITRYNRSVMYALAVHQLAGAIREHVEASS